MRKETRTEDVIHIDRKIWDRMNWRAKRAIFKSVKIIEKGGEKREDDE